MSSQDLLDADIAQHALSLQPSTSHATSSSPPALARTKQSLKRRLKGLKQNPSNDRQEEQTVERENKPYFKPLATISFSLSLTKLTFIDKGEEVRRRLFQKSTNESLNISEIPGRNLIKRDISQNRKGFPTASSYTRQRAISLFTQRSQTLSAVSFKHSTITLMHGMMPNVFFAAVEAQSHCVSREYDFASALKIIRRESAVCNNTTSRKGKAKYVDLILAIPISPSRAANPEKVLADLRTQPGKSLFLIHKFSHQDGGLEIEFSFEDATSEQSLDTIYLERAVAWHMVSNYAKKPAVEMSPRQYISLRARNRIAERIRNHATETCNRAAEIHKRDAEIIQMKSDFTERKLHLKVGEGSVNGGLGLFGMDDWYWLDYISPYSNPFREKGSIFNPVRCGLITDAEVRKADIEKWTAQWCFNGIRRAVKQQTSKLKACKVNIGESKTTEYTVIRKKRVHRPEELPGGRFQTKFDPDIQGDYVNVEQLSSLSDLNRARKSKVELLFNENIKILRGVISEDPILNREIYEGKESKKKNGVLGYIKKINAHLYPGKGTPISNVSSTRSSLTLPVFMDCDIDNSEIYKYNKRHLPVSAARLHKRKQKSRNKISRKFSKWWFSIKLKLKSDSWEYESDYRV